MIKDKITEIITTLIRLSKSGDLQWKEDSLTNQSKRAYQRNMYALGQDGTRYEVEVKFTLSGEKWSLESTPSMWIKNYNLPNGSMYIYAGSYDIVKNLRDEVKSSFCSDMNPTTQVIVDALEDIHKGINFSKYRDNKLEKVLDSGKNEQES